MMIGYKNASDEDTRRYASQVLPIDTLSSDKVVCVGHLESMRFEP